jgi:hypothetical protein
MVVQAVLVSNACVSSRVELLMAVMAAGEAMSTLWHLLLYAHWLTFAINNYFVLKSANRDAAG